MAFSARSVRIRLGRMFIVLMGISSAIAFVVVLLALGKLMEAISLQSRGAADVASEMRVWWIVVALLIGVTGITNAILMSVTERIKEIGTIRCLGAMSIHIIQIFLFEAMFLGLVGGVLGGIMGLTITGLYALVAYGWKLVAGAYTPAMIGEQMVIAVGLSMVLCVVSAIYPVLVAARLQPADAMRYEV
jgi:ABC-type lipoprotein release transport system permease subunit